MIDPRSVIRGTARQAGRQADTETQLYRLGETISLKETEATLALIYILVYVVVQ